MAIQDREQDPFGADPNRWAPTEELEAMFRGRRMPADRRMPGSGTGWSSEHWAQARYVGFDTNVALSFVEYDAEIHGEDEFKVVRDALRERAKAEQERAEGRARSRQ